MVDGVYRALPVVEVRRVCVRVYVCRSDLVAAVTHKYSYEYLVIELNDVVIRITQGTVHAIASLGIR